MAAGYTHAVCMQGVSVNQKKNLWSGRGRLNVVLLWSCCGRLRETSRWELWMIQDRVHSLCCWRLVMPIAHMIL